MAPPLPALAAAPAAHQARAAACTGACLVSWKAAFAAVLLAEGLVFASAVFALRRASGAHALLRAALDVGGPLSAGVFAATGLLHVLPEALELFAAAPGPRGGGGARAAAPRAEFPWACFAALATLYALFLCERVLGPRLAAAAPEKLLPGEEHTPVLRPHARDGPEEPLAPLPKCPGPPPAGFASWAFAKGLILVLGLSAHSLFESLALGLSADFPTVLNIFIATAAHRWATATAIAFRLARELRYAPFVVLVVLFSAMVPLGIGVGAALDAVSDKVRGVLFAASAGTFLYIGLIDAMLEGFADGASCVGRKFTAMVLGAAVIVGVTQGLVATDVG